MGVYRYEDLRVWQEARAFCLAIFELRQPGSLRKDYELWNQLNAASISTVANIAEGFVREHRKEFAYFVRVASGSNAEAQALLYVAYDRNYFDQAVLERLVALTNSIGRMLRALETSLRTKH